MENRFDLFRAMSNGLLSYALDAFFGTSAKNKGSSMFILLAIVVALALLLVLLYAGAEAVFLLMRNNFGSKGVKKIRVILAGFTFWGLAYLSYNFYSDYYGDVASFGSEVSYIYASITFLVMGFLVLGKGLRAGGKSDDDVIDPIYRGDSSILSGLVKEGWAQSTVQDIAEPLLFLALGVFLLSFNYIWGLPFIFCAFACWFHLAIESMMGFFKDRKLLSDKGLEYARHHRSAKIAR